MDYIRISIQDLSEIDYLENLRDKEKNIIKVHFKCEECKKDIEVSAKSFLKRKEMICGHCSQSKKMKYIISQNKEEHINRWKKAIKNKYGIDNVSHDPIIKERKKDTNLKKYGNEYAIASPEVRRTIKETFRERYGVDTPGKIPEVIQKSKQTCQERYGGWYMGSDDFKKKSKQTNIIKFNKEYAGQNEEVKKKKQKTNMKRYGVKETFSSPRVKEKRKNTMIQKYGVEYPMQSVDIKTKALQKSGHRRTGNFKGYMYLDKSFDSSYELVYYLWLEHLNKSFVYHPNTPLAYMGDDGKEHLYMPDFLIEGIFYEIKGGCFFNKEGEPYNQYQKKFWWDKYKAMKDNNIIILREQDIKEAFNYVKSAFGKNFVKNCKV